MKRDMYIMFLDLRRGRDGYKYVQNVKYRIQKETDSAFYLMGINGCVNRFFKSGLRDRFVTGNIIRN